MKEGNILIADDNKTILNALQTLLQPVFNQVRTTPGPDQLITMLSQDDFDVVILDMNFKAGINTGNEGLYWLREIRKKFPAVEVVMITAYGDIELAVMSLKDGAADFVLKPWDNEKLIATIKTALRLRKSNKEIAYLKNRENLLKTDSNRITPLIAGKSSQMHHIMQMAAKVAVTDANVLITGENGTGKELIAREIHRLSNRRNEMFVLVDLSSLAETLIESELFGHKKGAFTNAYEDKTGRFLLADKGTLFLDEIGNIPLSVQSKLLTVLQTRNITPVGSNRTVATDIRLISATNKNLTAMIDSGQFRQDLMYRINTIQLHIPPLRERVEDIDELALFYVAHYAKKYAKEGITISEEAINKLKRYAWPGNIRELQHTIEKAVILTDSDVLGTADFMFAHDDGTLSGRTETLEEMEKRVILTALRKNNQNQSVTADQLGITRQTLYNKLKKYGI